jgi:hypothetical protein
LTAEEQQRNDAQTLATIFSERYGTYTGALTQANLLAMKDLMSDSMYASAFKNAGTTQEGVAISTQVLSTAVESLKLNATAVVKVSTIRNQSDDTNQSVTQDLTLRMVQKDDAWKVDSAQWGVAKSTDSM